MSAHVMIVGLGDMGLRFAHGLAASGQVARLTLVGLNQGRGPGCFLESLAHAWEGAGSRGRNIVPYLSRYFDEWARIQAATPGVARYDRFDLNGDGISGGPNATAPFDHG